MSNAGSDGPVDTANAATRGASGGNGQPDPLASLHKMSRTAGLGSQEYVAVNPGAVVTLLLGLASVLALLLGAILLVIPAIAVIVGIIAIRQIAQSAGTQTGKGIALAGMLLALLFVGLVGGRELLHALDIRSEQGQLVALIDQLGKNVSQGNYDAAWDQFGPRFKERVKKETFVEVWTRNQAFPTYGPIKSMRWNGILDVQIDPETGAKFAVGLVVIDLKNGQMDRRQATFRKIDGGGWAFEDLENYFPQEPVRRTAR